MALVDARIDRMPLVGRETASDLHALIRELLTCPDAQLRALLADAGGTAGLASRLSRRLDVANETLHDVVDHAMSLRVDVRP